MQHTSPLEKGRKRGDCLYQTLCTIYICSKVNTNFLSFVILKIDQFFSCENPNVTPKCLR